MVQKKDGDVAEMIVLDLGVRLLVPVHDVECNRNGIEKTAAQKQDLFDLVFIVLANLLAFNMCVPDQPNKYVNQSYNVTP